MILIVGLGNPGEKFKNTRHNLGFMVLDKISTDFVLEKKFESETAKLRNDLLAKPQTFMNNSGKAVKKLISLHNIEDLIVIHDDMDLNFGTMKVSKNRGSAGHKGVESIIKEIGEDFTRIRLGILPITGKPTDSEKFVISSFKKDEEEIKDAIIEKAVSAINVYIDEGLEKAMNEFNK